MPSSSTSDAFVLVFLGTDTKYTPKPTDMYPNGETLSYIASIISDDPSIEPSGAAEGEESNSSKSWVLLPQDPNESDMCNKSMHVVEGPVTTGSDVGEKIRQGLFAALHAIARGKKTICLLGHSRGAVEGIVFTNEIAYILDALQASPQKPLWDILSRNKTSSLCRYTKCAIDAWMKSYIAEKDAINQLGKALNSHNLGSIQIHAKLCDPVPGESAYTNLERITWDEPVLYRVPKLVKKMHITYMQHEYTRAFRPIKPTPDSPETQMEYSLLPGHHGSAQGILNDRGRTATGERSPGSEHHEVQIISLAETLDFLREHGVVFNTAIASEHPLQEKAVACLAVKTGEERAIQRFNDYQLLQTNLPYFENFALHSYGTTSYTTDLPKDSDKQPRYVKTKHNDTSPSHLNALLPIPLNKNDFVNTNHAMYYMRSRGFSVNLEGEQVDVLHKLSETLFSPKDSKFKKALAHSDCSKLVKMVFKMLTESLMNQYTMNHLTDEKKQLITSALHYAFSSKMMTANEPQLLTTIRDEMGEGLVSSIMIKQEAIVQYNQLNEPAGRISALESMFAQDGENSISSSNPNAVDVLSRVQQYLKTQEAEARDFSNRLQIFSTHAEEMQWDPLLCEFIKKQCEHRTFRTKFSVNFH